MPADFREFCRERVSRRCCSAARIRSWKSCRQNSTGPLQGLAVQGRGLIPEFAAQLEGRLVFEPHQLLQDEGLLLDQGAQVDGLVLGGHDADLGVKDLELGGRPGGDFFAGDLQVVRERLDMVGLDPQALAQEKNRVA